MIEPVVPSAASPFNFRFPLVPIATTMSADGSTLVMVANKAVVFTVPAAVGAVSVSVIVTPSASTPAITRLPVIAPAAVIVTYCGEPPEA